MDQAVDGVIRLKQSRDEIYEYACHEGNYDVMHGILAGARAATGAAAGVPTRLKGR